MPDPVTNIQIEDVLSSIRKLVSEEVRVQTQTAMRREPAEARPGKEERPGKLVLSPSQRVEDAPEEDDSSAGSDGDRLAQELADGVASFLDAGRAETAATASRARPAAKEDTDLDADDDASAFDFSSLDDDGDDDPDELELAFAEDDEEEAAFTHVDESDLDPDATVIRVSEHLNRDRPTGLRLSTARKSVFSDDFEDDETAGAPSEALSDDSDDLDADDTGADDLSRAEDTAPARPVDVPSFLRKKGVTSLEERIAELEAAVSESEEDWESEEETRAATGPIGSLPWDDHVPDLDGAPAARGAAWSDDEAWSDDPETLDAVTDTEDEALDGGEDDDAQEIADRTAEADLDAELSSGSWRFADDAENNQPVRSSLRVAKPDPVADAGDDEDLAFDADAFDEEGDLDADAETSAEVADPVAERDADYAPVNTAAYADEAYADEGAPMGELDTLLDEDMLRVLVADIVRQELQGALGERITRNVRKLVRREIHRTLTAQNLI